jgi:biopolymer transport protein ExbD
LDNYFKRQRRRDIKELQIAPILDMLVAVIFFLLLSTSFIDYTKQTVPPSGVKTITDPIAPPPMNPKLYGILVDRELKLILRWAGSQPGEMRRSMTLTPSTGVDKKVVAASSELIEAFKSKNPREKSLSLAFTQNFPYQKVISVMDGVRAHLPDLILVSYDEADALRRSGG